MTSQTTRIADTARAPDTEAHQCDANSLLPFRSLAKGGGRDHGVARGDSHFEWQPHPGSHSGSCALYNCGYIGLVKVYWYGLKNIPLRESLIASNVSSFACFAAVTGFGVALAWWTTAWTDHFGFGRMRRDDRDWSQGLHR